MVFGIAGIPGPGNSAHSVGSKVRMLISTGQLRLIKGRAILPALSVGSRLRLKIASNRTREMVTNRIAAGESSSFPTATAYVWLTTP
jgi:hypothetical protein